MEETIRELMTTGPICLGPTDTVLDAAEQMRLADLGDVIVTRDDGRIDGIVTDRDLVLRVMAEGADPAVVELQDVVTANVATVAPWDPVDRAVDLMRDKAIRRLPVVEDGRPVGIVSLGDLARGRDPHSLLADISNAPPQSEEP